MNNTHFLVRIPRLSGRTEAGMEAFFADIHRQLLSLKNKAKDQVISLELVLNNKFIYFYVSSTQAASDIVSGQLYAHFPGVELEKVTDYLNRIPNTEPFIGCNLRLEKKDIYPIKVYPALDEDSLIGFSGVFSKMTEQELAFLQIIFKPIQDTWVSQGKRYIKRLFHLVHEPKEAYEAMQSKFKKLYFATSICLGIGASRESTAEQRLDSFIHAFSQFDNDVINTFMARGKYRGEKAHTFFKSRSLKHPFILNIEELASIYHFPTSGSIPNIIRVLSHKAEPPPNLPKAEFLKNPDISTFAVTNFRNDNIPFGIKRVDRRRHLYIVGKTGMGKSKLLELLMLSDIYNGHGFAMLDPHGDLAEQILEFIPRNRVSDVIYFNPADEKYPVGFNPLEVTDKTYYQQVVTGFIAIFKKLFTFGWTPRLEHMLRFVTLALLETKGATVVDIPKLLTNKSFRQDAIAQLNDPVVKNFWTHEFASWNEKYDNEAIVPILNKVSEFISSPLIRNTLGQEKSSFKVGEVMEQNKILIVNLSSGKLGEENSSLLGSMIVTQIQQAAMARASLPEKKRKDFFLYVDEFQNFATSAFATILSEARKYRLCLTIAHQYIDQLDSQIQKTVFGNIGSMVVFRMGAQDAKFLETELSPVFSNEDLMNLDTRQIAVKLSIDGATPSPFSAQTITIPQSIENYSQNIIKYCRDTYSRKAENIKSTTATNVHQTSSTLIYVDQGKDKDNLKFEEPII